MRKRFVSLVAAAALLGSVSLASAGTVTTKGDTDITISGSIQTYFDWANNQANLGYQANPKYNGYDFITGKPIANGPAQTALNTTSEYTRISLGLDNKAEGITGLIEGDFFGGGNNQQLNDRGNFQLKQAYVVKSFCKEGCNYTPWLLVGQTYDPLYLGDSFSLNEINGIAGQNANADGVTTSQIGFGVKFDLGSIQLNPSIYVANLAKDSYFTSTYGMLDNYVNPNQRLTSPGYAVKLPVTFNTGLGAPATVTAGFAIQPMKLTFANGGDILLFNGATVTHKDENENAWMLAANVDLPIYFVNLKANVHYGHGMTGYENTTGFTNYIMPSFYVNQENGSVEPVHTTAWTAQAQVDFGKLVQIPATLGLGYGQVVFSNYKALADQIVTPFVRKQSTMFTNVSYNLTKSLSFGVEYQRNKTYYIGAGNDPNDGRSSNQVFLKGEYRF